MQTLFDKALLVPKQDRVDFLNRECGDDESLAREAESLLDHYEQGEDDFSRGDRTRPLHEDTVLLPEIEGYHVLSEIHRGGQGVVFRAKQESSGLDVAIKVMLSGAFSGDTAKRRFSREIQIVQALEHPGIVPIIDNGGTRGQSFFVMPFVEGEPFITAVRSRKYSNREAIELFVLVCNAVEHAHQAGVVHRDLKHSNVLLDQTGNVHVLDFGIAKPIGLGIEESITLSATGQLMGTLSYMSPEQADGQQNLVDQRSDVYSLGVMLYEILTGRLPFDMEGTLTERLTAIKNSRPDQKPLVEINANRGIISCLLTALSKDPESRYASAGEFARALQNAIDEPALPVRKSFHKALFLSLGAIGLLTVLLAISSRSNVQPNLDELDIPPAVPANAVLDRDTLALQINAMNELIGANAPPERLVEEMQDRFGMSDTYLMGAQMKPRAQADLRALQDLAIFLSSDPSATDMGSYLGRLRAQRDNVIHITAGRFDEMAEDLLETLIEAKTGW